MLCARANEDHAPHVARAKNRVRAQRTIKMAPKNGFYGTIGLRTLFILPGFTGFYRVLPGFSEFRESSRRLRPRGSGCGFRVQLCAFLEPHCTSLNASFGRRGWAGPSERNSELPRPSHRLRQMATGRRVRECVEVRPTRSVNLQSRTQGTSFPGRKCRCVGAV